MKRGTSEYEANEAKINELKCEIKDAIDRRDYYAASLAQRQLDQCLKTRQFFLDTFKVNTTKSDLEALEQRRIQEETELRAFMTQKSMKLLQQFHYRYEQMKNKHKQEIDLLEKKFNNPLFGSHRLTPNINSLYKAETYYAQHNNYQLAASLKLQIYDENNTEINSVETRTEQTIQAQIAAAMKRHQKELKGFRDRMEIDKNNLKFQATNALIRIHNKYSKLRRHAIGIHGKDPYAKRSVQQEGQFVYNAIEQEFTQALEKSTELGYEPSEPLLTNTSIRSGQCTPREPTNNLNFSSFMNQYEQGPKTARNPRVQIAIERSLRNPSNTPIKL